MSRVIRAVVASSMVMSASAAHAEWKGKGEAGFVMARGNTETETLNAKLELSSERDRWKHSAFLAALSAADDAATTAERYEARWQSDYKLTDRTYAFGGLRYEKDRFSGFDYQASASTGLGYNLIDTERTRLSIQGGVGYRLSEDALTGEDLDEVIFRGDIGFEHQLTETTKVIDKFIIEAGSENTFVGNDIALEVKINDTFALSLGYGVRYNSDPPPGLENTDTLTTVNLVYAF